MLFYTFSFVDLHCNSVPFESNNCDNLPRAAVAPAMQAGISKRAATAIKKSPLSQAGDVFPKMMLGNGESRSMGSHADEICQNHIIYLQKNCSTMPRILLRRAKPALRKMAARAYLVHKFGQWWHGMSFPYLIYSCLMVPCCVCNQQGISMSSPFNHWVSQIKTCEIVPWWVPCILIHWFTFNVRISTRFPKEFKIRGSHFKDF